MINLPEASLLMTAEQQFESGSVALQLMLLATDFYYLPNKVIFGLLNNCIIFIWMSKIYLDIPLLMNVEAFYFLFFTTT